MCLLLTCEREMLIRLPLRRPLPQMSHRDGTTHHSIPTFCGQRKARERTSRASIGQACHFTTRKRRDDAVRLPLWIARMPLFSAVEPPIPWQGKPGTGLASRTGFMVQSAEIIRHRKASLMQSCDSRWRIQGPAFSLGVCPHGVQADDPF